MPDGAIIIPFLLATLIVLLIPGPAVAYIVTRSLDQGPSAGMLSVLGLGLGGLLQVLGMILGISAVILASATAFMVLKYLGALYLIYLGIQRLRRREAPFTALSNGGRSNPSRIFLQGILVNLLNPKIAIFILAFFPQFIDPAAGDYVRQALCLGALYVCLGVVTDSLYALLAGQAGRWFHRWGGFGKLPRYAAGSVYIGLGVATAVSGFRKH
ncbi:LysE family translocator [Candidatus Neomarinimicrobiota bacterium]